MLAITVKPGESFIVGDAHITIGPKNKIYVDAPKRVRVIRCSVLEREDHGKENKEARSEKGSTEESPGKERKAAG